MIVLRLDSLGQIHYQYCDNLGEIEKTAVALGALDNDHVIVVHETLYTQTVLHYRASQPGIELKKAITHHVSKYGPTYGPHRSDDAK